MFQYGMRCELYFLQRSISNGTSICILLQAPGKFDADVVQRQLRYTGMLATVQIRQAGYNYRLTFQVSFYVSFLSVALTGKVVQFGHLSIYLSNCFN